MNKQDIIQAIDQGLQDASAQGIQDWMGATNALIDLFVKNGEPFSSGELAAHLRTFKPNLRFSVTTSIGAHLRERFNCVTLPSYVYPDGSSEQYVQVPRVTEGYSRTPPGQSVFVYALTEDEGRDHKFEVEIPLPGTPLLLESDGLPAIPQQPVTPASHYVQLAPRQAHVNLTATVHTDSRCCIPRGAFEELLHSTGSSLRGGDDVFVSVTPEAIRVSLRDRPNYKRYSLQATRGRILVPHPTTPFTPNDSFPVRVDGDELVVDL